MFRKKLAKNSEIDFSALNRDLKNPGFRLFSNLIFPTSAPYNWDCRPILAIFFRLSETQLKTFILGSDTIFDLWGHFKVDFRP